jgi:CheY-like chemotaxis protein
MLDARLQRMARVVIADDDPEIRTLLRAALGPRDHQVRETASGLELLEALAYEGPFDLIVTDLMMPHIDGVRVIAMARNAGVETPVLIVTAHSPDDEPTAAWLGRARILRKPFALASVREAARALMPAGA